MGEELRFTPMTALALVSGGHGVPRRRHGVRGGAFDEAFAR